MKSLLRVLVTGVGAPGIRGTLFCLRKGAEAEGVTLHIVGTDINQGTVGSFMVDKFIQIEPPESKKYVNDMLNICVDESVDIVLPQTTRELYPLAWNKHLFEALCIKVMVSDAPVIDRAINKFAVLSEFEALDFPIPNYQMCASMSRFIEIVCKMGYPDVPVAVKPPFSNGMRGFRVLRIGAWNVKRFLEEKPDGSEISLEQFCRDLNGSGEWPELLVMEYLPGPEYSVDAFIGEKVRVAIPRLRQKIRSGISFDTVIEQRTDITQWTLQYGEDVGLRYAFGLQYKLDKDGVPKVLECNPRVQGTMVASYFAGANMIWMSVKELMGEPVKNVTVTDASFQRYWGGIGLKGDGTHEEI